ncbi:transporter substrate-binding domain-containing protein [Methylobacterium brachythecii]|uniref:ABC transporter substrate-binding protein n=1 Tax=Methylobacterium brachythecii TaxID=1176177 RepID=A0A7W6AIR8_9HYPH|nr:transporter substrate-binding domain-containing protein [Methylobacterium brachythecii]MBB3904107.1 polar amino acid transport system substrate-binding protein [Methylobacterium brachythecii]GLS42848.1 ABC transporter substrate-binding protein [Methylobacterium brachythecii]
MPLIRSRLVHLGLAVATVLTLGASASQSANLDEIKARKAMTVATEDSYKPFEYVENGTPMGLDHELLALLRKTAPFKIDQQIIPWTGLLAGVATGKYDVALTAAVITPERIQSLAFTMPIAEATQYYVVRADETRIKGVADLAGKTVGVQSGGASYAALADLEPKLAATGGKLGKVMQYTSLPEAYQDLANGRLDYVINGVVNLTSLTKEQPKRFKMGEAVGAPTFAAWAVAKGNDSLLAYLDEFMTKVRANGELYALQEKWLGRSFKDMPSTPTK